MKKVIVILVVLVGLLLAGFGSWQYRQEEVDFYKEMALSRGEELRGLAVELSGTKARLYNTRFELVVTNTTLAVARGELEATKAQLKVALSELEATKTQIELVMAEWQAAKLELQAREEYYKQKLVEEYGAGYADALAREVDLRDPTYEELKEFLASDRTDRNLWIPREYVCFGFAADLANNAEAAGIRAAYVLLVVGYTPEGWQMVHVLNGFQTTDKGFVFVEPQTDGMPKVEVGRYYWDYHVKKIIIVW